MDKLSLSILLNAKRVQNINSATVDTSLVNPILFGVSGVAYFIWGAKIPYPCTF